MTTPRGHVFVLRGDLRRLVADAWLLPTDRGLNVSRSWRGFVPSLELMSLPGDWGHDGSRVAPVPGSSPRCWVGNVGRSRQAPEWYAEAARQFIRRAAEDLAGTASTTGRPLPLLALPLVGTGYGGGASISGLVTRAVVEVVAEETARNEVDTCVVCWEDASYAAFQRARTDLLRARRGTSAGWAELSAAQMTAAGTLGQHADAGALVLFLGAGLSAGAGLPDWSTLLDDLAGAAGVDADQRKALARLPELDRARIIAGRLIAGGGSLDQEVGRRLQAERYPLAQGLAASLPTDEVVTMNYDELFEMASEGCGHPAAVLPWESARSHPRWLLKMHGCVRRGDIVLTRDHYHQYEHTRAALSGIVQALLITRHMLFLGFSLSDPNFHRIVGDVRQAVRRDTERPEPFGTAVVLQEEPLMDELWRGDITFVPMGGATTPKADTARRVELFLDRIAFEATDDTAHLMDPAYDGILTDAERWLRDQLQALRYQQPAGVAQTKAWLKIEHLLNRFGDGREP